MKPYIRLLLLLLFVCLAAPLSAQQTFSSRVVDAKTGEGIPYATIRGAGMNGTQANIEGYFSLKAQPQETLHISCMGFETQHVKASQLKGKVALKEAVSKLREVEVRKMEPLLVRVSRQMSEAYKAHKKDTTTFFLRQTQTTGRYREMGEAFFVAQSATNLRNLGFITGRHGKVTDGGTVATGNLRDVNFHYLLEMAPMIHNAKWDDTIVPLKDGATEGFYRRNYDITYDLIPGDDGHDIYVIAMNAKPGNQDRIYTGVLYVDAETLQPLRMDGRLENYTQEIRRNNSFQVSYEPVEIKLAVDYSNLRGYPEVVSVRTEWHSSVGLSQTQAFRVENLQYDKVHYRKYANMYDAIDHAGFDEAFWREHDVLRRTAEEEALARQFTAPQSIADQVLAEEVRDADDEGEERPTLELGAVTDNPATLHEYAARLQHFGQALPQEKVYVHMDNTCYFAGDTIFFAAYTRRTDSGRPSAISRVFYAELWTPEGYLVERQLIKMSKGRGEGSFVLPDTLYGGYYELRAYTRWQLNWGLTEHAHTAGAERWFYSPELARDYYRDYDKLYSRVFPIYDKPREAGDYQRDMTLRPLRRYYKEKEQAPDLKLSYFPEGGALVEGVPCRVAFEAATEDGEWLEGQLAIVDQRDTIATAGTVHCGRGVLEWVPQAGHTYRGIFTATGSAQHGRSVEASLPQAETDGVAVRLDRSDAGWTAAIAARGEALAQPLGVTVMQEGTLEFFTPLSGEPEVILPKAALRMGVNQLTVFDANGRVWADRLFFVQPDTLLQPTITVEGVETSYEPFAQIELALQSERRKASLLSVAVRDAATQDNLYDNGSIFTEMLLASEVKGFIPHPGYYFEAADEEHRTALDLLMLTQGWRRFDWHVMAFPKAFEVKHPFEYNQILKGQVLPYEGRTRQEELREIHFENMYWAQKQAEKGLDVPPPTYHQSTVALERVVSSAHDLSERRQVSEWLYGRVAHDRDDEDLKDTVTLRTYVYEIVGNALDNPEMMEYRAVLHEQLRNLGTSPRSGAYRLKMDVGETRFPKQAGSLPREMRLHAEYALPGYETIFGEVTTRDGQFSISTPEIHGACYFFLAASDTTRWKRGRSHDWVNTDETRQPETYVRISWPYPRFVKPYNHYQQMLAPVTRPSQVSGGEWPGSMISTDLSQVTVHATRGGMRRFDVSHPTLKLDAYSAFNDASDAGFMMGWYEGRIAFTNALARCYMGDMNSNNPYLVEPRYNGRNISFNIPIARINDYNYLYNLDSVYIYTDYAPRLPDERFTEENMPRVTIDLRKAADETQRYTYRDRRYILPGFSVAEDFYSPNYRLSPPSESTRDYRRTLYWNPALQLDAKGRARIQLFTGSKPSAIIVQAEGLAADGTLLYNGN